MIQLISNNVFGPAGGSGKEKDLPNFVVSDPQ